MVGFDATGPVVDIDWMDDLTFATCSPDRQIYVHKVLKEGPIMHFRGHTVSSFP